MIPFSCKQRGACPSCDAKRAHIFAENLQEHVLLPYPHVHQVFTIPKRLRVYFHYDRKLLTHLYRAAHNAWRDYTAEELGDDTSPGMVMALHTDGDLLNFHPHIHALTLAGSMNEAGELLPLPAIDAARLRSCFLTTYLSFYCSESSFPRKSCIPYIPDTYEQTTRFYGCYSCRARGKERKEARVKLLVSGSLAELEQQQEPPTVSRYWATWIKKVYEIDPLKCPKCGELMKIVAFLHDPKIIKDICTSLGIAAWRAPPKIKTASYSEPIIIPY